MFTVDEERAAKVRAASARATAWRAEGSPLKKVATATAKEVETYMGSYGVPQGLWPKEFRYLAI